MPRTAISPVTYLLRDPKSKVPTPINCIVRFNNLRMNVGTGFKVNPNHWSTSKERIKNVVDAKDQDKINTFLDRLSDVISDYIVSAKAANIPLTKEMVRQRIDNHLRPAIEEEKPTTLLDFVDQYIQSAPNRLVRGSKARSGRLLSPDTIRRYITTRNGLKAFASSYPRPLTFENIDLDFYNSFTAWLVAKNYSTNNVSKYIENVKGFMSVAVDEELTTNLAFRKFSNLREDAENIYLSENELQSIYKLDLSNNLRLDRVRDLFLFASWTGLRYSDFSKIQREQIEVDKEGNQFLNLRQQKTSVKVYIPMVHDVVKQILKKYDNVLPHGISNQKTNDYIKEICKMAEINKPILKHITKGGKQMIKTSDGWNKTSEGVEKWKLVTTHTARRSFATNMYKRKMPIYLIMKITGHKKETEFLKYIKVDDDEVLASMKEYLGGFISNDK